MELVLLLELDMGTFIMTPDDEEWQRKKWLAAIVRWLNGDGLWLLMRLECMS